MDLNKTISIAPSPRKRYQRNPMHNICSLINNATLSKNTPDPPAAYHISLSTVTTANTDPVSAPCPLPPLDSVCIPVCCPCCCGICNGVRGLDVTNVSSLDGLSSKGDNFVQVVILFIPDRGVWATIVIIDERDGADVDAKVVAE